MEFDELLRSRIHRTLRKMRNYKAIPSDGFPLTELWQNNEQPLGIYYNTPDQIDDAVWITTHGLYISYDARLEYVGYPEIVAVQIPESQRSQKETVNALLVRTQSKEVIIPIRGGEGKFRDVWAFMRFLLRISDDCRKYK